ncbi:unnamed protein product [Linum trigynum]|uniref:Uncharacterized protein n=1 Tax=Linum trigynum TaxID=586398 RepID=A0AAV2FDQ8_9ROSI
MISLLATSKVSANLFFRSCVSLKLDPRPFPSTSSMVSSSTKELVSINTTFSLVTSLLHLTKVALVLMAVAEVGGPLLVAVDG